MYLSAAKPEVIPLETTVTAVLGLSATLSVTVKADPPATPDQITWYVAKIIFFITVFKYYLSFFWKVSIVTGHSFPSGVNLDCRYLYFDSFTFTGIP